MIPFTKEERTVIAEFVYSKGADILIVSDCTKLVEVLANHNLISNKEELLKKIDEKHPDIVRHLSALLTTKVSSKQGEEIMDEYFGKKPNRTPKKEQEENKEEEKEQHERWGVGKEANSKAFDNIKIGDEEFDLIHGQYPHSRRDNTTYARHKKYPENITGFDGHRIPFKIEIEEYNYLKSSGLSGDEIRKGCTGKLFLDGQQIFECGGRTYDRAYKNIERFIDSMEMMWSWYPKKVNEEIGKLVKYEGQMFRIKSFIISLCCMILDTDDGKPRKPFQSESEDVEEGDFENETSIKVEVNSDRIWWFPTDKEKAKYESVAK